MSTPYTYLIGWSKVTKYYYGVRYSKNCHPDDLFRTYFTSSKKVKEYLNLYGHPDIIKIRKIFKSNESAVEWEQKVLRRLKVPLNEKLLNANVGGTHITGGGRKKGSIPPNKGLSMSNEQKEKLSATRKRLGLGLVAAKYLPLLTGNKNHMRNPEYIKKFAAKITGRKRLYRDDGSWSWHYPNESGPIG